MLEILMYLALVSILRVHNGPELNLQLKYLCPYRPIVTEFQSKRTLSNPNPNG